MTTLDDLLDHQRILNQKMNEKNNEICKILWSIKDLACEIHCHLTPNEKILLERKIIGEADKIIRLINPL